MIAVKKGMEPDELKELRDYCKSQKLSAKESYKTLRNPLKKEVLRCLKRDQGQLCVYCMCKIPRDVMQGDSDEGRDPGISGETIEHFLPLSMENDPECGLDYQNMYAVCHGNTKTHIKGAHNSWSFKDLTCDKHRNNESFRKINPAKQETLETIYYELNGEIHAKDPDVEFDLTDTLNLNCVTSPLISERKEALDTLILDMESVAEADLPTYCRERLNIFMNEGNPKTPYVGILIWYLQSMCANLRGI